MRVRHPYSLDDDAPEPDGAVHWGGRREWSEVDEYGTFYVPDGRARSFVEGWPTAEGYSPEELLLPDDEPEPEPEPDPEPEPEGDEPDACEVVKTDGEVCGRERPCPYHD